MNGDKCYRLRLSSETSVTYTSQHHHIIACLERADVGREAEDVLAKLGVWPVRHLAVRSQLPRPLLGVPIQLGGQPGQREVRRGG